jgi:hypothetical protein
MNKEIQNKATEIPDEEVEKATGGKTNSKNCHYHGTYMCNCCGIHNTSHCKNGKYDTAYENMVPK